MSVLRQHLEAQLRQLRRESQRHPWLLPRVAALLVEAGRMREAATLARRNPEVFAAATDGLLVRAELMEREGDEAAARALREELCERVPGICSGWMQRLNASVDDSILHLEVLRAAWELDQFSPRLNAEMEKQGLRRTAEYEQALRPTATEAARREEQFRRLLDKHVHHRDSDAKPLPLTGTDPTDSALLPAESETACEASQEPATACTPVLEAPLPEQIALPRLDAITGDAVQELNEPAHVALAPVPDRSGPGSAEATVSAPEPAFPEAGLQDGLEDGDEGADVEPTPELPLSPQRERQLQEQAERLSGLTRPLKLSAESAPRKATRDADLFDPRSMMTRRLAAIYLEQGYPALAVRTLEVLAQREPEAADLAALLAAAREVERRLAEQAPAQARRRK